MLEKEKFTNKCMWYKVSQGTLHKIEKNGATQDNACLLFFFSCALSHLTLTSANTTWLLRQIERNSNQVKISCQEFNKISTKLAKKKVSP
jgi:hypothetical protein